MRYIRLLLTLVLGIITATTQAQTTEQRLRHFVDSIFTAHPKAVGVIVHVESPGEDISWSYAAGISDKQTEQKLQADQPVITASNTKTYVAATIMGLVEQGKLTVDASVENLLQPKTATLLSGAGYKLHDITIRQLLSHTSGMRDFAGPDYFDYINQHKQHQWTRDEQIALSVKNGGPYAQPADSFRYADMNYLLLTEIIETITKKPFHEVIRKQLKLKRNGLHDTWWMQLEKKPKGMPSFAHQYWDKYPWDAQDFNPSWDLYGGGGLAATAKDMALFYQQLFTGKIVKDTAVLAQMYRDVPCKMKINYCLGLRKVQMNGVTGYYHGGFFGTDAIYFPALNTSVAIVVLQKEERDISAEISKEVVRLLQH